VSVIAELGSRAIVESLRLDRRRKPRAAASQRGATPRCKTDRHRPTSRPKYRSDRAADKSLSRPPAWSACWPPCWPTCLGCLAGRTRACPAPLLHPGGNAPCLRDRTPQRVGHRGLRWAAAAPRSARADRCAGARDRPHRQRRPRDRFWPW